MLFLRACEGAQFVDAFHAAIGGTIQEVTVRDPMMRFITAKYLLCDQEAVIEMAQASGLTLLSEEERNPMVATSYGTGQLIADASIPRAFLYRKPCARKWRESIFQIRLEIYCLDENKET